MTHPYHLAQEMLRLLRTEMPDIVLTQLEQSDVVIKLARAHGIPTILFLTDAEPMAISNLVSLQAEPPTGIVCVSRFVRSAISDATEEAKKIFYPPIAMDDYLEKRRSSASYITCINPVLLKGGAIVEAIIRRLPQEKFLLVEGWYDPLRDGFDFRKYPNVTYLDKQSDMRSVYKRTKLLLVPSVWDEAIPRVIMEAGINGIPSIASRRGGIPEAIGHGGILIDHPYRITDWVNAITVVQSSPKKYQTLSAAASSHSQTFSIDLIGPQFEKWLQMIQKSYRRRF
jgi:glycosyltransferase involved in cell wall biosynthesis